MRCLFFVVLLSNFFSFSQVVSDDGAHEQWEYSLEYTGDFLQLGLPVTALITTIVKKDWQGTKQFALSYSSTILITHALKKIVHKQRPEGRVLYDSFPSGHTSSAFSGASFIQRRYGWKFGKYAYLLATVVAVSRTEAPDGWHDTWDVVGGAILGIGSTYLFTKAYTNNKINISFDADKKYTSFSIVYNY